MKLALASFIIALLVTSGQCLKCYSGTGTFATGFSEKECASNQEWCRKSTTGAGLASVEIRDCHASNSEGGGVLSASSCQSVGVIGVGTEICYCNTDLCNGAQGARPLMGLAMALVSIGVFSLI